MHSYLTTPLYYLNARPHLGHAYTTILADVVKRYRMQRGEQVTFLTGTDEHGEKIQEMAKLHNKAPQTFADEMADEFQQTWKKMDLCFDIFYRTTNPHHMSAVQTALQGLKDRGDIVFREYEGHYCVGCERFLTESELTATGVCPDHLKKPELRKESNYFFLMSRYQTALIHHLETHPQWIRPHHFQQEMASFLKQPLTDLCISRPKTRLSWGIELPFDSQFVTYVWFDALLNYLVATGWPHAHWNRALWETGIHFIAKDILKAHAIYWGTMLFGLQVPLPLALHVSGYWLVEGTKMSKTLGNVIRPLEIEEKFGRDTLRFYLLRDMSYGLDSTFTLENYIQCINAHLANGIGNFFSRVYTLAQKHLGHITFQETDLQPIDSQLLALRNSTRKIWNLGFSELKYHLSLKAWCDLVTQCDLYVNETKPWILAKDPAQKNRLQTVMGVSMRMMQALGALIAPVLPHTAIEIRQALNLEETLFDSIEGGFEDRVYFQLNPSIPKLFMRIVLEENTHP